jgi:hypothetical protein
LGPNADVFAGGSGGAAVSLNLTTTRQLPLLTGYACSHISWVASAGWMLGSEVAQLPTTPETDLRRMDRHGVQDAVSWSDLDAGTSQVGFVCDQ